MRYIPLRPMDQSDQYRLIHSHFTSYKKLKRIQLCNAGMGSGKSRIIASMPRFLKSDFKGVTFIITPNKTLQDQLATVIKGNKNNIILNHTRKTLLSDIAYALARGQRPFICFNHIGPHEGKVNSTGQSMINLIEKLAPSHEMLVLIDELDSCLTSLTGGINAKLDHSATIIKAYSSVANQKASINIFDIFRAYDIPVFGFSGTLNNVICSKLSSMGYDWCDIEIINVAPMKSLYDALIIKKADTSDFETLLPHLLAFESGASQKGLLIFGCADQKTKFKQWYALKFGQSLSCVDIDCQNAKERDAEDWSAKFAEAKYVCGLNMVGVGFDLSTVCEGQQFGIGVLFRKMSDKISQPLAKNPEHQLHMEESASILQALARLRTGGVFVVPEEVTVVSLYDGLLDVFKRIENGYTQIKLVGNPRVKQVERYHQGLLLALIQNMKLENRPVVNEVLSDLKEVTGLEFDPDTFVDPDYWIDAIGVVWAKYLLKHAGALSIEEKAAKHASNTSAFRSSRPAPGVVSSHAAASGVAGSSSVSNILPAASDKPAKKTAASAVLMAAPTLMKSGGGVSSARTIDIDVKAEVIARAYGVCCHCGELFTCDPHSDDTQICHVQRSDCDGPYTLDNLMYGHRSCDASFDAGRIIHDPSGGYWLHKLCSSYVPDQKQIAAISSEFIAHRFAWEKKHHGYAMSDDMTFRDRLLSTGFVFKA